MNNVKLAVSYIFYVDVVVRLYNVIKNITIIIRYIIKIKYEFIGRST